MPDDDDKIVAFKAEKVRSERKWQCLGCGIDNPCTISIAYVKLSDSDGPELTIGRTCMCDVPKSVHWTRIS